MQDINQPTILFFYKEKSSFVQEDLRILTAIAQIKEFSFTLDNRKGKLIFAFSIISNYFRQLILMMKYMLKNDILVYCWFADYHSFVPTFIGTWFNIPVVTVLGGYDCIKMKKLNYGVFISSWRRPQAKFVLNNSDLLLPVDKTLIETNPIAKHWPEAHPNGVKFNISSFNSFIF